MDASLAKLGQPGTPDQVQVRMTFFDQDLSTVDAGIAVLLEARDAHRQRTLISCVVIGALAGVAGVLVMRRRRTGRPA